MPDPYRARGWPRTASERRSPVEDFAERLRQLGATEDEVQPVVEGWDLLDPDDDPDPEAWTRKRREALLAAGDDHLLGLIRSAREEYAAGTTTEEEEAERNAERDRTRARAEAPDRIGGSVQGILAWVGDSVARAEAVMELETAADGAGRKTLLAALERIPPVRTGEA